MGSSRCLGAGVVRARRHVQLGHHRLHIGAARQRPRRWPALLPAGLRPRGERRAGARGILPRRAALHRADVRQRPRRHLRRPAAALRDADAPPRRRAGHRDPAGRGGCGYQAVAQNREDGHDRAWPGHRDHCAVRAARGRRWAQSTWRTGGRRSGKQPRATGTGTGTPRGGRAGPNRSGSTPCGASTPISAG